MVRIPPQDMKRGAIPNADHAASPTNPQGQQLLMIV